MENKAVSDTGPIIHLTEIDLAKALEIFSQITIPPEIANEIRMSRISLPKGIKVVSLTEGYKDKVKLFTNEKNLDMGEAQAISLALQEGGIFLTDDLDAREIAKEFGIEVHGSLGIILRAFRERKINKMTAIEKVENLHSISSLFITRDLIEEAVNAINHYNES